jgi:RnfABCDGE-type electron transport complex B subunit
MNVILIAVIVLGAIGLVSALVLFFVSKKFAVKEDPRLAKVSEVLPQANCGGCGFPGCGGLASACVKAADAGSLEGLNCPVGGQPVMEKIAAILGMEVGASTPKVAVVRCNGSCENRPKIVSYDGVKSCRIANTTCSGETACAYGCLGCGDCVNACKFNAIRMNPQTGLQEVDMNSCTACGACSKACPRNIIEIRNVSGSNKEAYVVECMNKDKGAIASKACSAACIGCMKCEKVCGFDAVHVENNVAYINPEKCQLCGECEKACPKNVIAFIDINGKKPKAKPAVAPKAATTVPKKETVVKKEAKPREPITIKFDGPMLPAVQYVLATPTEVTLPEKSSEAKSPALETKEVSHNAPLPAAMQILLGQR